MVISLLANVADIYDYFLSKLACTSLMLDAKDLGPFLRNSFPKSMSSI